MGETLEQWAERVAPHVTAEEIRQARRVLDRKAQTVPAFNCTRNGQLSPAQATALVSRIDKVARWLTHNVATRCALRTCAAPDVSARAPAQVHRGSCDALKRRGCVAWANPPLGAFAYATDFGREVARVLEGRDRVREQGGE